MANQTTKISNKQLRRIVESMVVEAIQKEDLAWPPQYWTEDDVDDYRAAQKRGDNPNQMVGPEGRLDAKGRPIRATNTPPTDECCDGGICGFSNEAISARVAEAIRESLVANGGQIDEGFFDQLKQGAKSFFGNGYRNDNDYRNTTADRQARGEHTANWMNSSTPMNLKQRWNAAKTGYQQQGYIDNADKIVGYLNSLEKMLGTTFDQSTLNKMTIGQLKARLGGAKGAAVNRVRGANNAIYKGQQVGVMGSGRTATV